VSAIRNGAREADIPDVLARIVRYLHQDGRYLIPTDSSSIASGDGVDDWLHPSWSSSSSQMAIDGTSGMSIISGGYVP